MNIFNYEMSEEGDRLWTDMAMLFQGFVMGWLVGQVCRWTP